MTEMENSRRYMIVAVLYVALLLISNIMASKVVLLGGMILPAAVVVYPFSFMMGDVLTEVWGFQRARQVIWLGFLANVLMVVFATLGQYMTPAPFWPHQEAYKAILGAVPRIVLASFVAYLAGELSNSYVLEAIKQRTGNRLLFVRTIGSTLVGQVLDTALFIGIAFAGTMPAAALLQMMMWQYLTKVTLEAVGGTPLAYALVNWARGGNPAGGHKLTQEA